VDAVAFTFRADILVSSTLKIGTPGSSKIFWYPDYAARRHVLKNSDLPVYRRKDIDLFCFCITSTGKL
jgi:hypothetical protein